MGDTIEIDAAAGSAEAYLTGEEGRPGVLFYVDAIGLRPQVEAMADRIAGWGYVVLVPHVFYRDGRAADLAPAVDLRTPGAREAFFVGAMKRVRALTPDLSTPDAEAFVAALSRHSGGDESPIGVTGYCMGARLAVRLGGLHPDRVAAVGGFHGGGLVTDAPDSPHLAIAHSRASYVFGHADHDASMPPEAVAALGSALAAAGRPALNEVYANAQHGYTMADTSMHDEIASERHFRVLRDLLGRSLA